MAHKIIIRMSVKSQLRRSIKGQLAALSATQRQELSAQVLQKLEQNDRFANARIVMLFYSLPDEVCTHEFVARWAEHKTILLPIVEGDDIKVRQFKSEVDMKAGAYHIGEPQGDFFNDLSKIEVVVVPGVAFDACGNRMGRGRAYYDHFLSLPALSRAYKIGLCYPLQLVPKVPIEPHDVPMDCVIA